ncbi:MAG: hypothetical protein WB973_12470 [Thermoanaerobaculia bacterium]
MIRVFVQAVLVIAAGGGLFWLWRLAAPSERWLRYVIAAGFLGRALLGQALFWISWARLPLGRSLQNGDGLWFFAADASLYFPSALTAARNGLSAIYVFDPTAASRIYVQTLAVGVWLFGAVASTAVLLNLFFYLGTVALITRWPVRDARSRTAAAIAVTAISLSPAFVLWSLQPLKDTYFQFFFVSFIAGCAAWQRAWAASGRRLWRAAIGAFLLISMFGLSSIRWYFGFVLLLAASFFLLLMAFTATRQRPAAVVAAVVLSILLARALVVAAGVYLPTLLIEALNPRTTLDTVRAVPAFLFQDVESARTSFDAAGGDTAIGLGSRLRRPASVTATKPALATPAQPPISATPVPASSNPSDVAEIRAMIDRDVAIWNRGDIDALMDILGRTPDAEWPNGVSGAGGWRSAFDYCRRRSARLVLSDLRINGTGAATATVSGRWEMTNGVRSRRGVFSAALRRVAGDGWKPQRITVPPPPPRVAPTEDRGGEIQKPSSRSARLVTGAAVLILPRSIGEWLGIFHIGGGRGMLFFTEIDTVIFDAALLLALFAVAGRFRVAVRDPLTWLTFLVTLLIGIPLLYSISNFGTLFRLREMIYIGLVLTPLAVATATPRIEKPPLRS